MNIEGIQSVLIKCIDIKLTLIDNCLKIQVSIKSIMTSGI